MMQLGKILTWGALAAVAAVATGCGDDTSGAGGGGGSSGTAGDGGASSASSGGPTTGPGSTGSSSADTSSPASSGSTTAPASSGSGGTCGSGDGTPEEVGEAYREYCAIASDLALEVCGGEDEEQACLDLESLIVQASAGCEAEQAAFFACINPIFATVDPESCNCDGDDLACPGIDPDACAAEEAAVEACDACNG
jgi:hypothetical protein